jgi:hypothetical protein
MDATVLNGVGKSLRKRFLKGEISESKVIELYHRNVIEAEAFSGYGFTEGELVQELKECHNPILRKKLEELVLSKHQKCKKAKDQNKVSLEKLQNFLGDALGIGLKKVIHDMKKRSRKSKDLSLKIVTLLLETEFANLSAKSHGKKLKDVIYERKCILLSQLASMLSKSDWKYGYNCECGKNANFIIYIYLPDGVQLSWHCNEFSTAMMYPYFECEWDGQACMTMEKILSFIACNYTNKAAFAA